MKTKALLVGGAGFIGSHLTKTLLSLDCEVFVLDSFIQYSCPLESGYSNEMKTRFNDCINDITLIRGDVRNPLSVAETIREVSPTHIVYLAAMPLANLSNNNAEEAFGCTVGGLVNCLEVIKDVGLVQKFVYVSSSMVYGDFQSFPCKETHPTNPKDLYGGFKLAGENIIKAYGERHYVNYSIVRPSAVYGPTDTNCRVSQIFVERALQNKKIVLHNNGQIKLDFTYVEDLVNGISKVLMSKDTAGETFNITRGEGRSLLEFVEILKDIVGDVNVEMVSGGDDNRPKRGALCIDKAKAIGYNPTISLEEGLIKYIDYYRSCDEN